MAEKREKKKFWKGTKALKNLIVEGEYEKPDEKVDYVQSPSDIQTLDVQSGYGVDPTTGKVKATLLDYAAWLASLPSKMTSDRLTQYAFVEQLIETDDYQKCLQYISIRACSRSTDTGKIIHTEPDNDADANNEYYLEAKQVVSSLMLDKHISDWMLKTDIFGMKVIIPLKEEGIGVTGIYDDKRLHPKYCQGYKWFDKKTRSIKYGYVFPRWQKQEGGKGLKMFLEDDIVIFKRKKSIRKSAEVQNAVYGSKEKSKENFNLWDQKTWLGKYPITDYGHLITVPPYEAFVSLANIRYSIEKSRIRAGEAYAMISVPTDGLDPAKAQEHSDSYGRIFNQIYNKAAGVVKKTIMHIVTIPFNAIKQRIEVLMSQQDPNINGLVDLEKAEARFTSAWGLDSSVIAGNAGEVGGLGGAGLMDATTAESAQMSKDSNACGVAGVEEILRIHFLTKYGIVFTQDNKPYKVRIHTGDTRAEKERLALEESRRMQVNQVVQEIGMLSDFMDYNGVEAMVQACVKYLHMEEADARKIYRERPKLPPGTEEGMM